MDRVKLFKGCLPQISLGPFLNTLCHLNLKNNYFSESFHETAFIEQTFASNKWGITRLKLALMNLVQRPKYYFYWHFPDGTDTDPTIANIERVINYWVGGRGISRTLSNIYDGAFCEKNRQILAVNYWLFLQKSSFAAIWQGCE